MLTSKHELNSSEFQQKILSVAMKGEKERGDHGAVLYNVDTRSLAYLLSHEFKVDDFREALEESLTDNPSSYHVVMEENQQLHMYLLPKLAHAS